MNILQLMHGTISQTHYIRRLLMHSIKPDLDGVLHGQRHISQGSVGKEQDYFLVIRITE